jgi:hypothetical protein
MFICLFFKLCFGLDDFYDFHFLCLVIVCFILFSEYPVGRYLRDAKLYEIGAGTSEIRRMLIGRELFQETKE